MAKRAERIRVLIADDHAVFRYGLRALLESEPGFSVVGETADGLEVTELITTLKPSVLMLDLAMPRLSGLEVLRKLASTRGQVRTIVLTAAIENGQIVKALQLGARGVLLKDAAIELVTKCIEKVLAGEYWIGREAVTSLMDYLQGMNDPIRGTTEASKSPAFTPREREIISGILAGQMNKDIGAKLSISEDTVKRHLSNIFGKSKVSNRLELAIWATNNGFL